MPRKRREKQEQSEEPKFAPGMDIDHQLKQDASKEEVKEGEYTEVTTLSLDETDPR